MKKSEIRKHYFLDEYVIIAPRRAKRPDQAKLPKQQYVQKLGYKEKCFFCPENVHSNASVYEIIEDKKWIVKVVENKYPALTLKNPKAFGKQEVVIDTPEHEKEINDLSIDHIVQIIEVYIERTRKISEIPGIKYISVFKNEGGKAGASVAHSHSQIIALPIIPPDIQREANVVDNYILEKKACPYCDIIKKEQKAKVRVVFEDKNIFAITPYASKAPYEAWILPKRHFRNIGDMMEKEEFSLAKTLKVLLSKLDSIDLAYNYFIHNSLELENHHWSLKIQPRPNIWGGLELGSGVVINSVVPEEAAKFYRKK